MAAKLSFTAEAGDDLFTANGWHEARRAGLGDEFMSQAEAFTDRICRSPEILKSCKKTIAVQSSDAFLMRSPSRPKTIA